MAQKKENHQQPEKSERLKKLDQMMFSKHWQITFRVIGITALSIGLFAGGGHLIDTQLNTAPVGLIVGSIIAYPIAQLIIYKVFKKVTK